MAAGGWLAGVCNPIRLRFSLKKSLYNMAKSRITCREGDGWRWDTARDVGLCWPKENRREREGLEGACGRGGETQEKGWEGSRDGWRQDWVFKREGNAAQRPGAPLAPGGSGGAGVGTAHPEDGLSPELLGGSAGGGEGAGYRGCSALILSGCRMTTGCLDNLILQPGRKTIPTAAGSG